MFNKNTFMTYCQEYEEEGEEEEGGAEWDLDMEGSADFVWFLANKNKVKKCSILPSEIKITPKKLTEVDAKPTIKNSESPPRKSQTKATCLSTTVPYDHRQHPSVSITPKTV